MTVDPQSDTEAIFDDVTSRYYQNPDPARAAQALRHLLGMLAFCPEDQLSRFVPVVYLFWRIAKESEVAHAAFMTELASYDGPGWELTRRIVSDRGDDSFTDETKNSITHPAQLDLLWADFFVTGQPEPIARIISVLDGDDLVRRHLERWLAERSWFGGGRRRGHADALRAMGIDMDLTARAIRTDEDLDCVCFAIAESGQPIFSYLRLEPDTLASVAVKGSALWSLRSNATKHPIVGEVCRREAARAGGPGRRRLRDLPTTAE